MELWSAEAKTVRVGWYPAPGLQDGDDAASLGGYNYEYLSKIAQYEDWNCVFIFGPWGELEQKLINGEIDILGDVAKTEARLSKYDFGDYPNGYSRMLMEVSQGKRNACFLLALGQARPANFKNAGLCLRHGVRTGRGETFRWHPDHRKLSRPGA